MRNNFLQLLLILLPFTSFAQLTPACYFDKDLNLCSKSKSVYSGEGKWEGDNYRLDLYQIKNHYHVFAAHYTDSTFAVMNGQFVSYYENGAVENVMYYKDGKLDGLAVKRASDHKLIDSVWYKDGEPDSSITYNYDVFNRKLTTVIKDNYIDSSIVKTRYDNNEKPIERDASDSISAEKPIVVANPDEEAAFPGDDSTMNSYFQYKFSQHRFNLILLGTSEACSLSFIVNKNGKASDIQSIYCDNYSLRNDMADAVNDMVWLPATKDGKSVASVKEITEIYSPSITGLTSDGQRRYFFDENFNSVPEDDARYFGKLTKEDDLVKLTVHYKQHSNRIFSMHFTDSTLQTASGEFESFFYDDQKEVQGNFLMGRKNGWWLEWNNKGQVTDSSLYVNRMKTYEVSTVYQPEGAPAMRTIRDYINNKKREIYYDRRNVTSDVTVPIFGTEHGNGNNVFTSPEVAPSFPGGAEAWNKYVNSYLNQNSGATHRGGTCVVRFIVDTDGKVYGTEALTLRGSSLANIMISAVMSSPGWIPATQNGKKVKAYVMSEMHYTFFTPLTSAPMKRYIHPLIINSVKKVNPIYKSE
jgi:antitoxin component YwqK of YwqJK toxin-antitoxin module